MAPQGMLFTDHAAIITHSGVIQCMAKKESAEPVLTPVGISPTRLQLSICAAIKKPAQGGFLCHSLAELTNRFSLLARCQFQQVNVQFVRPLLLRLQISRQQYLYRQR